jgi:hypothetical protein
MLIIIYEQPVSMQSGCRRAEPERCVQLRITHPALLVHRDQSDLHLHVLFGIDMSFNYLQEHFRIRVTLLSVKKKEEAGGGREAG